jgi:hypothetical protein
MIGGPLFYDFAGRGDTRAFQSFVLCAGVVTDYVYGAGMHWQGGCGGFPCDGSGSLNEWNVIGEIEGDDPVGQWQYAQRLHRCRRGDLMAERPPNRRHDQLPGERDRAGRAHWVGGTNDNPVLIAVLAAAFIGERMTLRRTIGRLMAVARVGRGSAGPRNRRTSTMPPAGGASTKTSIPRKRTCAAVGVEDHRVGFAGWFVMQSAGDEAPMIADDVVSASVT